MRSCWGDCFFDFSGDFAGLFLREGLKISFVNFQNRKPDESLFHGRLSVGLDFDRTHRRFRFAFGYVEHCRKRDQMLLLFPGRYLRLEEKDLSFARHAEPAWPISAIGPLQGRPGGGARFRGSSLRVSRHRQQGQNENGDQNSRNQNSHAYFHLSALNFIQAAGARYLSVLTGWEWTGTGVISTCQSLCPE